MQQQVTNNRMERKYNCRVYNTLRAFLYCSSIWVLFMALLSFVSLRLNILILFPVGFICSLTLPFISQRKIKNFFTKNAILVFDTFSFSIELRRLKDNEPSKEIKYNWDDIKAYKFYFTPSKLTYVDIYFKNGGWKEFGFKDNKTEEESISSESIFSIFRNYVKQYNSGKDEN